MVETVLFPHKFRVVFFMYMSVSPEYMYVSHVCLLSAEVRREGIGVSGTVRMLEWIPGPLQEHETPLSTEPSLQSSLKSFGQNLCSLFVFKE